MLAQAVDSVSTEPWKFQWHPEVWILVGFLVGAYVYMIKAIGPKAVPDGVPPVTRKNKIAFGAAMVMLWVSSDWPIHDIAEEYLYSVHMLQHLLITFFIPLMFLAATPEWLARLIIGADNMAASALRRFSKPIVAGLLFNFLAAITHWNGVVQLSADSGVFHYGIHLAMFASGMLMWMPVFGPIPELRIPVPAQMIYLFLMSIIPTVPAGWLTFADNPVYPAYDIPTRLWGISVVSDQQAAGFVMKVLGGFFLWSLIFIRFSRWANENKAADREKRTIRTNERLTYEQVSKEFERTAPSRIET